MELTKYVKPTKEQFEDYVNIRNSGVINMNHVTRVVELARTDISYENCYYIMKHFTSLAEEYGVDISRR